jgi:transposase InsO family protein
VIDAHSRRVIGWAIADHMRTDLVEDALKMAITLPGELPTQVVFHTDRGTQIRLGTNHHVRGREPDHQVDGLPRDLLGQRDGRVVLRHLEDEFYYRRVWPTKAGASRNDGAWIEDRYNRRRRHSSIGQISPVAFEMQHSNQTAAEPQAA